MTPSPEQISIPKSFVFCLRLLYFVLPPLEEIGLPFWVSGVLCQLSEVILWRSLNIQMIFWCICGGESVLLVLFLHHLGAAAMPGFLMLRCMTYLYILDINPLLVVWFTDIFSHFVGYLFVMSVVTFAKQNLLCLIMSHLFIFAFMSFPLEERF